VAWLFKIHFIHAECPLFSGLKYPIYNKTKLQAVILSQKSLLSNTFFYVKNLDNLITRGKIKEVVLLSYII
jgi:hypothetical protein